MLRIVVLFVTTSLNGSNTLKTNGLVIHFGAMAVWLLMWTATLHMGPSGLTTILAILNFAGLVYFVPVTLGLIGYGALNGILKIPSKILAIVGIGLIIWLAVWLHSIKPTF